ncbi:unnamed protein product [Sphacelaria rigidula]
MGAGGSKQPSWYPGEPAVHALAECSCAKTGVGPRNSSGCTGMQGMDNNDKEVINSNLGLTATTVSSTSSTGSDHHRNTAATPATTTTASVRGGRDASSLAAVELSEMEVCVCV